MAPILRRTDQAWPSDNTDAPDRLSIQSGFTQAYTPHLMIDWVTDSPDWLHARATPLKYRFVVAMTGGLALGMGLNKLPPVDANFSASEYVSDDARQVVLFAFLHAQQFGRSVPQLYLQRLDTSAVYR